MRCDVLSHRKGAKIAAESQAEQGESSAALTKSQGLLRGCSAFRSLFEPGSWPKVFIQTGKSLQPSSHGASAFQSPNARYVSPGRYFSSIPNGQGVQHKIGHFKRSSKINSFLEKFWQPQNPPIPWQYRKITLRHFLISTKPRLSLP